MRNIVSIGDKTSQEFWIVRELRRGCPLNTTLFNIYVQELEEEMEKGQIGGIIIGKKNSGLLCTADDIVLLAKRKAELKEMMKRFRRFLERKGLSLSSVKSYSIVFENKRRRTKKKNWKWKEESIEEVKKIRYLGYML